MNVLAQLRKRSGAVCELCRSPDNLNLYEVPPVSSRGIDTSILACDTCIGQIEDSDSVEPNHWRCLNESMWSEHKPVKVVVWRMLSRLRHEGWPKDLLDMMYLEEDTLEWAKATDEVLEENEKLIHRDVNGVILEAGDNVVLIKDLKVKGSSMIAKQGTAVRRISLDPDNATYIEGKVDGQQIVLITEFVKKT
ncbi:hypothetical protein LCGC14_0502630 [marine sediment metagenome]|uniref:PhnA protein n=2 Tax=root TaxID=1 RepID=A0A831QQK0_9FLAO|nr:PhnA protein [Pricia sp.]HEA22835.1 PhnA protein [Pricia antarctica]